MVNSVDWIEARMTKACRYRRSGGGGRVASRDGYGSVELEKLSKTVIHLGGGEKSVESEWTKKNKDREKYDASRLMRGEEG